LALQLLRPRFLPSFLHLPAGFGQDTPPVLHSKGGLGSRFLRSTFFASPNAPQQTFFFFGTGSTTSAPFLSSFFFFPSPNECHSAPHLADLVLVYQTLSPFSSWFLIMSWFSVSYSAVSFFFSDVIAFYFHPPCP